MATGQGIRASDTDREHAVEALRDQYAEGRLTLEEFDERVSAAYTARTWTDLRTLTRDLPVKLSFGATPARPAAAAVSAPGIWRFAPLLPLVVVGSVALSASTWHHGGGHHFPFFPVIPLTIVASVFAWRWLLSRQWRRAATTRR